MATSRDVLWASGHDETVEVNQRALIDKVLARYSGEFTVFRELLQNSDDAQARAVEICFETNAFLNGGWAEKRDRDEGQDLPDLKTAIVDRWTFKNNGIAFRDEDWNRLKKIAEGNPDEEKIGAFGVGFYSLFSVTEEPFVTSGDQWMGFYWKDKRDQLFARRGQLPLEKASSVWTSFEMVLREPAPIPFAFDFTRFLASSVTFMNHLSEVSVFFDDKCLVHLQKTKGIAKELEIPKGLRNTSSSGIMTVKDIRSTPVHIQANVMHCVYSVGSEKTSPQPTAKLKTGGFFSSLFTSIAATATPLRSSTPAPQILNNVTDPKTINQTNVSLSIFSADVDVRLSKKVAAELLRSTKKNPPNRLRYDLIYTAKDEYDASKKEDDQLPFASGSVFRGLRADLDGIGSARIFIGHATGQTTGLGGHMASRFIPTVERESIDLMDRNVAIWNKELLFIGGFLSRAAYEIELKTIKGFWDGADPTNLPSSSVNEELQLWLRNRSIHALRFFTFHPSTPSADISNLIEAAFFACADGNYFPLISTTGVRNASDVRLPDSVFSGFLKEIPVLHEEVLANASRMIGSLQSRGMVKSITFDDVLKSLRARPLVEAELIACLKWWIQLNKENVNLQPGPREQFLDAAVLLMGEPGLPSEKIIPLISLQTFINSRTISSVIPLDGPLPDHLLPPSISKHFAPEDISTSLPWAELSIPQWVGYISSYAGHKANVEYDITKSGTWAERVLAALARVWPSLSHSSRAEIHEYLKPLACIPTSRGMKLPEEAYFAEANIFNDLPVVALPSGTTPKGNIERTLQALGVRKHVELQIVFNRMIKTNEWTVADLARYLVSVQSTLTAEEWARLKVTAAFFKEGREVTQGQKLARYQAQQLYEPSDVFRKMGLPVIDWGKQTKWRSSSDEAKFLFQLGLLRHPPLSVLINLCIDTDAEIRRHALRYLLNHREGHYKTYDPSIFGNIAFVPAIQLSKSDLRPPKDVFSSPDWASLGFWTLDPNLPPDAATKLKIRQHPPTSRIMDLLERTPPKDEEEARIWFSILAGRVSDFSPQELQRLSQVKIVPVRDKASQTLRWHAPVHCYFGGETQGEFHSKLFVFVNFGQPANGFLSACGTKYEPSVEEITLTLLNDPRKFYASAGGPTQFLHELRNIAINHRLLKSATISRMKETPILLGTQRKPNADSEKVDLDHVDDEEVELLYDLRKAKDIVIADDTHAHKAFGYAIFVAPQEDILEGFYVLLGSKKLSSLVMEEYHTTVEVRDSRTANDVRNLILERLPLFLHEHTHAGTLISYNWLNSPSNFIVKTYGKISVTKSLAIENRRFTHKQDASAVAQRVGKNGYIQLSIAGNAQIDMYEVALSLNRFIFESPKANDALLFMTILSTDLKALKRRGYNVDRILRQQQVERHVVQAAKKPENTTLVSNPMPGAINSDDEMHTSKVSTPPARSSGSSDAANVYTPPKPLLQSTSMNALKRLIGRGDPIPDLGPPPHPPAKPSDFKPGGASSVTPLSDIKSNIDTAIRACRPESGDLLRNRQEMRQVKESLNEGYCDVTGRVEDLIKVGEMGNVKVYVTPDVPKQDFMKEQRNTLARFIHILIKLAKVYDLPLTSLHIFYDLEGGAIGFNRNGSIFANLRYYRDWHDKDVLAGNLSSAYVSWYFTLAHEIAHNLVQPHNSEHEFYFSAICEQHLMKLKEILPEVA